MKTGFHWKYYTLTMLTANDMFELQSCGHTQQNNFQLVLIRGIVKPLEMTTIRNIMSNTVIK